MTAASSLCINAQGSYLRQSRELRGRFDCKIDIMGYHSINPRIGDACTIAYGWTETTQQKSPSQKNTETNKP